MSSHVPQGTLLHFATRDQPPFHRVPFWLEVFARQVVHLDVELQSDTPLEAEASLLALPGIRLLWCKSATPAIWKRTSDWLKDGDDDLAIVMSIGGKAIRSQLGRELEISPGDGIGILNNETASIRTHQLNFVGVMVPRSGLSPLVPDIDRATLQVVRRETGALRLLQAYLAILRRDWGEADGTLNKLAAGHIRDLVALSIGTSRDGEEIAKRSARAARLCAMKSAIAENPGIYLAELAERQGVTPRYVQMLFEEEGMTFTIYVLEQRLNRAHATLVDPRYDHWTIAAIAFHAGFGDISHFNRNFKHRYGGTPSEVRDEAQRTR